MTKTQCQRDFLIPNLPQSVNGWLVKDSRKIPNQAQSYKAFRSEIATFDTNKPVGFTLANTPPLQNWENPNSSLSCIGYGQKD